MKLSSAALLLALGSASATSFTVCSGKNDGLGISTIDFSEDPVKAGSTLTIKVDATPTTDITDGATLTFDILLGFFPVYSVTKDFCNDLGVTCPVAAGTPTTVSVDVDVQDSAPAASVTAEVTTKNGDGSFVSCVDIPMTIGATELPLTLSHEVELTDELVENYFTAFKSKFDKTYEHAEEEAARKSHFHASLKRIQARNAPLEEHTFGITKFSDMSVEEFKQKMLTYKPRTAHDDESRINASVAEVSRKLRGATFASTASDKDWRDAGVVTAVKDQGMCGSCWAFSTAEGVESAYAVQGGDLTELSVAQIVQCDTDGDDAGCNGGDTITAFDYIQSVGGLTTEADYPYDSSIARGRTGKCNTAAEDSLVVGTDIASWTYGTDACTSRKCDNQDEDKLAENLATNQPMSICVNAEPWQDYTTGVMKSSSCSGGYYDLDHCVHLVGFSGIDGSNGYWMVRNSWNTDWGVDGYIHLAYGDNTCGVADEATMLTLK